MGRPTGRGDRWGRRDDASTARWAETDAFFGPGRVLDSWPPSPRRRSSTSASASTTTTPATGRCSAPATRRRRCHARTKTGRDGRSRWVSLGQPHRFRIEWRADRRPSTSSTARRSPRHPVAVGVQMRPRGNQRLPSGTERAIVGRLAAHEPPTRVGRRSSRGSSTAVSSTGWQSLSWQAQTPAGERRSQ